MYPKDIKGRCKAQHSHFLKPAKQYCPEGKKHTSLYMNFISSLVPDLHCTCTVNTDSYTTEKKKDYRLNPPTCGVPRYYP